MMRVMLYEAAQSMLLHSQKWSWLKAWAMQIARRRGTDFRPDGLSANDGGLNRSTQHRGASWQ